jgi:hypothetical protein
MASGPLRAIAKLREMPRLRLSSPAGKLYVREMPQSEYQAIRRGNPELFDLRRWQKEATVLVPSRYLPLGSARRYEFTVRGDPAGPRQGLGNPPGKFVQPLLDKPAASALGSPADSSLPQWPGIVHELEECEKQRSNNRKQLGLTRKSVCFQQNDEPEPHRLLTNEAVLSRAPAWGRRAECCSLVPLRRGCWSGFGFDAPFFIYWAHANRGRRRLRNPRRPVFKSIRNDSYTG